MQSPEQDRALQSHTGATRRSTVFAIALVVVACATYMFKLYTAGIFACPADGYDDDWYLAYCNATAYGDFDHGAFWYNLIPEATTHAARADVLLVGSSRMQFGFSTRATSRWFGTRGASYYLLGFTHTENTLFTGPLLDSIKPAPQVLLINVDGFFKQRITQPTSVIFAGGDAPTRFRAKLKWQPVHKFLCGALEGLCDDNHVIFRNTSTGLWRRFGDDDLAVAGGTADATAENEDTWPENLELARRFLDRFDMDPQCIVLTVVPSMSTPVDEARWTAEQLGLHLVEPVVDNLTTYDSSHLDDVSAERWSAAFFEQASHRLEKCLAPGRSAADSGL